MKNCVQIQGYTRMLIYRQLPSIVTITTFKIERVIKGITEQHPQLKLFIRKETKICFPQEHQNPPNYGVDSTPTIHDQNITWQQTQLKLFIRKETKNMLHARTPKSTQLRGIIREGRFTSRDT